MKKFWCLFCFLLFASMADSQDYDKLNLNDSICKIIDDDKRSVDYEFEILVEDEYYLPYTMSYQVKTSGGWITKITRKYSRMPKNLPYEYAYDCGEEVYLVAGFLLSFRQYDFNLLIDPELIGTDDLIKKGQMSNPWELNVYFLKDEMIHYYSNGHGMTERDDFSPETHSKEVSENLKAEVKKRYPQLK